MYNIFFPNLIPVWSHSHELYKNSLKQRRISNLFEIVLFRQKLQQT